MGMFNVVYHGNFQLGFSLWSLSVVYQRCLRCAFSVWFFSVVFQCGVPVFEF